jgi:hypothetical protein
MGGPAWGSQNRNGVGGEAETPQTAGRGNSARSCAQNRRTEQEKNGSKTTSGAFRTARLKGVEDRSASVDGAKRESWRPAMK